MGNTIITGKPSGPITPNGLMVVGESFGKDEQVNGVPLIGKSGQWLRRTLDECGIDSRLIRYTNVVNEQPYNNEMDSWFRNKTQGKREGLRPYKGRYCMPIVHEGITLLEQEILQTRPDMVIALGNYALWALTGNWGITKWRGSQLFASVQDHTFRVVPIIHPAAWFRTYWWHFLTRWDISTRIAPYIFNKPWPIPDYKFHIRPTFAEAREWLTDLLSILDRTEVKVAHDLETRTHHISCSAFAWGPREAMCIPFISARNKDGYWGRAQELELIEYHRQILTHPNALIIGQNYEYDRQFILRRWFVKANLWSDTMTKHHTLWPGFPKSLDYLSSLYSEFHTYWKDELKEQDEHMDEDEFWTYNCKDAVITWEVNEAMDSILDKLHLRKSFDFQMKMHDHCFFKNNYGTRMNMQAREAIGNALADEIADREGYLTQAVGYTLKGKSDKPWWRSPTQISHFLFTQMKIRPQRDRKTGALSTKSEHFADYGQQEPLLIPLLTRIDEMRTLQIYLTNFVRARLAGDRIMTNFNVDGTETFRFSSNKNPFGEGTNLQNVPAEK